MQKYFSTFSACWEYATNALKLGSKYKSPEFDNYLHTGGVPYGGTWSSSFYLETPTGRLSKKQFHVTITRTSDGYYDCTAYIN